MEKLFCMSEEEEADSSDDELTECDEWSKAQSVWNGSRFPAAEVIDGFNSWRRSLPPAPVSSSASWIRRMYPLDAVSSTTHIKNPYINLDVRVQQLSHHCVIR